MTDNSDEINFKPYLLALRKGWWFILLVVIIGAGSTYLYLSTRPPAYSSTASILLTRTRSNLNLSTEFQTFNENVSDSRSRMDAIVAIAQSDEVIQDTLQELEAKLPPSAKTIQGLKALVKIKSQGDIISVTANTGKPNLSADLANSWANNAVNTINLAYGGEQSLSAVEAKVGNAEKEYQDAQSALETFISGNQIVLIQNRLSQALIILQLLQLQQTSALENVSTSQFDGIRLLLSSYYQTISEMDQLISQAEAIKQRLQSGNAIPLASAADDLASLLAKANAYGITNTTSLQVKLADITALGGSPADYVDDLDSIIDQAKVNKTVAQENINQVAQNAPVLNSQTSSDNSFSEEFQKQIDSLGTIDQSGSVPSEGSTGNDSLIQQTAYQVQQLNAQLEKERATLQTLTAKRDLSWQAYQALLQKVTELENSSGTNNNVSLASQAVLRQNPVSQNTLQTSIIVGILAGILGALILIVWQWFKHPEDLSKGGNPGK